MAVIAGTLHEDFRGRRAHRDEQRRSYTREFYIQTDSISTGPLEVRLATGVPRVFDTYPDDLGARAMEVEAIPEQDDGNLWRIRVAYSSAVLPAESENPLDRPKVLSWTFQPTTVLAEKAYYDDGTFGKPICNSAGMPFVPAYEITANIPTLQIVRNELAYTPATTIAYMDTVNSVTFYGGTPGQVKFSGASAQQIYEDGVPYWSVTYNFQFRREGWQALIPDMGLYEFVAGAGFRRIMEKDTAGKKTTTPIGEPVYFNGAGQIAAPGVITNLPFKVYKAVSFAPLNLE